MTACFVCAGNNAQCDIRDAKATGQRSRPISPTGAARFAELFGGMPTETRGKRAQCDDAMTTPDERAARRQAWHKSNPVSPGTVRKPKLDMPDRDDLPPAKAKPHVTRRRGILQRIGAGLVLLALSPLIIGLAPIWVPLNWYQNRQWRKDMARPRGCLTYRMTPEQLEYFEAQLAREQGADGEGIHRD